MKKIMLVGRSGAGKTTLTQAMKGREITYHKTQYINHYDVIIDTPGEYAENKTLARALILYSYEADVIGLLMSAVEDYSLYSPNIVSMATRDVVGIVTQIDQPEARTDLAAMWLELCGCRNIFYVSSVTGEGVGELLEYLREEGEILPWERKKAGAGSAPKEEGEASENPNLDEPGAWEKASASLGEPGAGEKVSASLGEPRAGEKVSASPGESGAWEKASASPDKSGAREKVSASLGEPGAGEKASASLGESGAWEKASASPDKSGAGEKVSASPGEPGAWEKASASPGEPGAGEK